MPADFDECTTASPKAQALQVSAGSPIFLIECTSYTSGNRPVDYERLHYRADLIRFVTQLARRSRPLMQRRRTHPGKPLSGHSCRANLRFGPTVGSPTAQRGGARTSHRPKLLHYGAPGRSAGLLEDEIRPRICGISRPTN
jgi:hypothetical protein